LQTLAKVNHVVFDKTGTLTENALQIEQTVTGGACTTEFALDVAASLEASSAHPIARAFRKRTDVKPAERLLHVAGGGLEGRVGSEIFRIGTAHFAGELNSTQGSELRTDNAKHRNVYLGSNRGLLARFTISEKLRTGAAELLRRLTQLGIRVTVASGDQYPAVAAMAARIGATDCRGGMLPEDKLALVRELQGKGEIVAAAGDGVNDSPVLAGANVSIAMGNGTSIAQHSADCIWLGHQLTDLDSAFVIARRTMHIVRQNLAWALAYNLTAIPLAMTGMLAPWMAALGMSLSSLLVMLNALRLSNSGMALNHDDAGRVALDDPMPLEIAG
jgi:Cu2+-exporting ATPase